MTPSTDVVRFVTVGSTQERLVPLAELPESIAFVDDGEGRVQVALIEQSESPDCVTIRRYAADGKLLATTQQWKR